MSDDAEASAGSAVRHRLDPVLERELPGLSLWSRRTPIPSDVNRADLRCQLRDLSGRWSGAKAVALRSQPIPGAYRAFYRHTGVDPDETLVPIEQAARDRLFHGGFPSRSLLDDALLIALVETGVPVWALDEQAIRGELQLRNATPDDASVPARHLVVADDERPLAVLFGDAMTGAAAHGQSEGVRLYSVGVKGVPAMSVEEALDIAGEALRAP